MSWIPSLIYKELFGRCARVARYREPLAEGPTSPAAVGGPACALQQPWSPRQHQTGPGFMRIPARLIPRFQSPIPGRPRRTPRTCR